MAIQREAIEVKSRRAFPFYGMSIRFGELAILIDPAAIVTANSFDTSGYSATGFLEPASLIIPLGTVKLPITGWEVVKCLTKHGIGLLWAETRVSRP